MLYLEFQHGLFHKYNYIRALIDSSNKEYHLVTVGEKLSGDEYLNTVAHDFHFKYEFAGCLVSRSKYNGINDYNRAMRKKIEKINGQGWEHKFRRELEELKSVNRRK